MSGEGCDLIRVSLGAYALGALDVAERTSIEGHLAECPRCRDELAALDEVAHLLALVPPEHVDNRSPGGRGARTRRTLAVAAAVAILAAGALGVISLAKGGGAKHAGSVTATATDRATKVSARAVLQPQEWGTAATLRLRGVRPHQRCRLVAVGLDGTRETAATWRANYEGAADVNGATAIQLRAIASLEVIADHAGRLVKLRIRRPPTRA